jgi:hypothetical protein
MSYSNNPDHKMIIDEVLHRCARMFQELGADSGKTAYKQARVEERKLLRAVRELDPDKIDRLLVNTDK